MHVIIICDDSSTDDISSNAFRFCGALASCSEHSIFYRSVRGTIADVSDAYAFITYNYRPGDKLYIFGFAGGAFAARVLANFVARFGVLVKGDVSHRFPLIAYKDGNLDDFKVTKIEPPESCDSSPQQDLPPRVYDVEIEVVGCWETTAGLGASAEFKHFDASLHKGIKHAFHALALDECRGSFSPTLWSLPDDPEVADSIDLQQCWFPGAHANVGGGYRDRALADVTLAWMVDLCRPFLSFNPAYMSNIIEGWRTPGEWHKKIDYIDNNFEKGEFDTENQGWGRGMCYDSYSEGHTWTWKTRTPGAYGGRTNETVHASARERWQSSRERGLTAGPAVWNPKALEGFTPRQMKGTDRWEWVKNDGHGEATLTIPEAPFPTTEESYEWQLRYTIPCTAPEVISGGTSGDAHNLQGRL